MRYRLRTLLIVLAIGPPMLWLGWTNYQIRRLSQRENVAGFYNGRVWTTRGKPLKIKR